VVTLRATGTKLSTVVPLSTAAIAYHFGVNRMRVALPSCAYCHQSMTNLHFSFPLFERTVLHRSATSGKERRAHSALPEITSRNPAYGRCAKVRNTPRARSFLSRQL